MLVPDQPEKRPGTRYGRDVDSGGAEHEDDEVGDLLDSEVVLTWWADVGGSGAAAISVILSNDGRCAR